MTIGTGQGFEGQVRPSAIEKFILEEDLYAQRTVDIPSNMGFRADYSSTDGQPDYIGYAPRGLAEGTNGWLLKKCTYDASRQCTKIEIAYGNWTNRASESYS